MIKPNKHINGVDYYHETLAPKYNGVMTVADDRIVLTGSFDICLMLGSDKFGDEIQFRIFAPKENGHRKEQRNQHIWNRTEINVKADAIDRIIQILQKYQRVLKERDNKLA